MKSTEYIRKKQPHFQHIGATFSITLMAHDAVPKIMLERLQEERKIALAQVLAENPVEEQRLRAKIHGHYEERLEALLNQHAQQEHPFKSETIAGIVMDQIVKYQGRYYTLDAVCIMSNHIHLLVDFSLQVPVNWQGGALSVYKNVSNVVGYIKGGASYRVNKETDYNKPLWAKGYYDRYIRSPKHYDQALAYIINNPVKAGIVDDWREYPLTCVNF